MNGLKNIYTFTLDTQRKNVVPELYVTQNDDIRFVINLMQNGQEMIVSGATPSLAVERLDRQTTVLPGTVSGNAVTFDLGTTETAVEGRTKAVVQLYDPDGRVSSMPFHFVVSDDPSAAGTIPSEREQTLIEVVLQDGPTVIEGARKAVVDAVEATSDLTAIKTQTVASGQAAQSIADEVERKLAAGELTGPVAHDLNTQTGVGEIQIWTGTLAEYEALASHDPKVIYHVRGV